MRTFPFPDKVESRKELKRDILYHKIPPEQCIAIADNAWETGVKAALDILQAHPDETMAQIAQSEGLTIEYVSKDNIAGNVRYFSEYYSGRKKIILYTMSIQQWAKANGLKEKEANELILSHEIYHHLECVKLGLTSKQYTIPTIKIGRFSIGKSGIRALSEIGAHGFSRTFYDKRGKLPDEVGGKSSAQLRNHAVNDVVFSGQNTANRIFTLNPILNFLTGKKGGNKNDK
jgi:hypothetical protein